MWYFNSTFVARKSMEAVWGVNSVVEPSLPEALDSTPATPLSN